MYNHVDAQAIVPGLKLVNEVGAITGPANVTEDQLFELRKKQMLEWCQGAETLVKTVVKQVSETVPYRLCLTSFTVLTTPPEAG